MWGRVSFSSLVEVGMRSEGLGEEREELGEEDDDILRVVQVWLGGEEEGREGRGGFLGCSFGSCSFRACGDRRFR